MSKEELRNRRFDNVRLIHDEVGDREFTERLELTPGRKNQLLNRHGFLGDQMARRIEGAFGFKPYWLDDEHPHGILAKERDITEDYIAERLRELVEMVDNIPDRELRAKVHLRCLKDFSSL